MRKKFQIPNSKFQIQITWLYPDLMNIYGDRGNVIVLQKRAEWRGIPVTVTYHSIGSSVSDITNADILLMGGAQDRQQHLVAKDIEGKKAETLKKAIHQGVPGLFVCGGYQFLGNYYKPADGPIIPGLGIFDVYTEHPGKTQKRLIGNIAVESPEGNTYVGFENHGGRTYLEKTAQPFARVLSGSGNNGTDRTEGVLFNHTIGTYLHGPILSKNPELADWLIAKSLEVKYGLRETLSPLDNDIEYTARDTMLKRLGIWT